MVRAETRLNMRRNMVVRATSGTLPGRTCPLVKAPDVVARSVRFATAAARHSWNKVLVRPT